MTWADIVRLVDQHPRLAVGQSQIAAGRGGVRAAGAAPNPTLEASIGHGRARAGSDSMVEWGLALNIPLGWIAQRRSRIDAAEAELHMAAAEAKAVRREVLLQLGSLFWNLAYDQARVDALVALATQTAGFARAVGIRVTKGEARPIELPRVEVEREKVSGELEAARISLEARQAQLSVWLGAPTGRRITVRAEWNGIPPPLDLGTVRAWTRKRHPLLSVAQAKVRGLEAELRTEKLARVPPVTISGFTNHELDRRVYGAGLSIELPIWNWNSGKIAQAKARLAVGQRQLAAARLELESSVVEAEAACRSGSRLAARFKNAVLPPSEKSAATVERMYLLGEASLLEVIDARRTLLDARRSYLGTLAQAQIDCSRLRAIVGKELP
ncbi:MAG: TolC family protein [Deltaproteobacteria bacterium]|nr:TolC family protein [Deltaproteobacteria bacterium]